MVANQINYFTGFSKTKLITKDELRKALAEALSKMFGGEVPEYIDFCKIVEKSNLEFIKKVESGEISGGAAEGVTIDGKTRIIEEKHGAIRVGTPEEMSWINKLFQTVGMYAVNVYDLTQVERSQQPITSTAYRPLTDKAFNISPFRMFTSLLNMECEEFNQIIGEGRHKGKTLKKLANELLDKRKVFSNDFVELLDKMESKKNGYTRGQANKFIEEALKVFGFKNKSYVVDFEAYNIFKTQLGDVAADIICFGSIHLNHLTPRAFDIEDAFEQIKKGGMPTIDSMQGPQDTGGVKYLLNQTSRKAPGEWALASNDKSFLTRKLKNNMVLAREELGNFFVGTGNEITENAFKFAKLVQTYNGLDASKNEILKLLNVKDAEKFFYDVRDQLRKCRDKGIYERFELGKITLVQHKARFGEIESRHVALTEEGKELYDNLSREVADKVLKGEIKPENAKAALKEHFKLTFPQTHLEMFNSNTAFYRFEITSEDKKKLNRIKIDEIGFNKLVNKGVIKLIPSTYEDFLPVSAASIFESNLSGKPKTYDYSKTTPEIHKELLEDAMGVKIIDPFKIYEAEQAQAIIDCFKKSGATIEKNFEAKLQKLISNNPANIFLNQGRSKSA